ncbi:MAG: hypothetical protein SFW62_03315 [Alphaproteobacteria bacterium]|nr:hypothetical protein [Alphaproteobacteria bacterium]
MKLKKSCLVLLALAITAMPVQSWAETPEQLQDQAEGKELITAQLEVMQIAIAPIAGKTEDVPALAKSAGAAIDKVLAKNPNSLDGLSVSCNLKIMQEDRSASVTCPKAIAVVSDRITTYPDTARYYKHRSYLYKMTGKKDLAEADLTEAYRLTKDVKEKARLKKDLDRMAAKPD